MDSHTEPEGGFYVQDRDHAREPQSRALEALSGASAYNDWIFSVFAEFIGDRALEIGCGTGNLTRHLLEKAKEVTAIDIDAEYLRVIVLVPAFNFLFSRFDELIGHHRRYTLRALASELTSAGFSIKKNVYFNFFGMAGWWWRFRVFKKEYLTTHAVRFFETLTPLLRAVESAVCLPVGLSVIAVGEKPLTRKNHTL